MDLFIGWLFLGLELKQMGLTEAQLAVLSPNHYMVAWSAWNAPSEPS